MNKRLFFYLKLLVSVSIVAYFFSSIDMSQVIRPILPSGWGYVAASVILANLDRFLMAYKWNLLLKAKNFTLSFAEIVKTYYIGTFWGIVLPSSIGGDAVRVYRVSAQTHAPEAILSSVVVERLLGLLANLTMVVVGAALFVWVLGKEDWEMFFGVATLFVVVCGLFWFSLSSSLAERLQSSLSSREGRWFRRLLKFYSSYRSYRNSPAAVFKFLILSVGEQCFPVICTFFISMALGLTVSLSTFFIFTPLIMGLSRIPISFDGFGIREGLYVYSLSLIGVPAADALVIGFLSHVVGNLSLLPGYLYAIVAPTQAVVPKGMTP